MGANRLDGRRRTIVAMSSAAMLWVAACSSGSDVDTSGTGGDTSPSPVSADTDTESGSVEPVVATDGPGVDTTAGTDVEQATPGSGVPDARTLPPPTGEPIVFGMVNSEGVPGLDFPELRIDSDLAVAFINEHGGVGGRPLQVEHCASAGSPESSQSCAQELTGKGVDLVMLGLDVFPGYGTYAASGIPVVGALPVLPTDYTADALFVSGGNATTMAAMAALTIEHFEASSVGIISADTPGSNSSEAALTGALDKAGVGYTSVKGGVSETDAGFQGLLREANEGDPDVLINLYDDAGCIGAMRGRVALGIDTPTISTPICGAAAVIDVVGDDALGWFFVGVGEDFDTATAETLQAIVEPAYGPDGADGLGIGALGINQVMTLARIGNLLADEGSAVTGQAIFDRLASGDGVLIFLGDHPASCAMSATYPAICDFVFPAGEFTAGGGLETVPGFEAKSVLDYLP